MSVMLWVGPEINWNQMNRLVKIEAVFQVRTTNLSNNADVNQGICVHFSNPASYNISNLAPLTSYHMHSYLLLTSVILLTLQWLLRKYAEIWLEKNAEFWKSSIMIRKDYSYSTGPLEISFTFVFFSFLFWTLFWNTLVPLDLVCYEIMKCFVRVNYVADGAVSFLKHSYNRYAMVNASRHFD